VNTKSTYQGEKNPNMGEQSKCLLIFAVILSLFALLVSLVLLGWTVYGELSDSNNIEELKDRLEDLETEHDYIIEQNDVIPSSKSLTSRPHFCSLLPDPGPCGSQVTRWYYLPREEDCIQFPWGGCQGNDNNFVSLDQCRAACHVPQDKQVSSSTSTRASTLSPIPAVSLLPSLKENFSPSDCNLPPDSGPCQDRITRFYHDGGQCQRFQYGGCSGNGNNFFTASECERHCGEEEGSKELVMRRDSGEVGGRKRIRVDSCSLPPHAGTCSGSHTRYRWDQRTMGCSTFVWTGCGGNSNNFKTREKCVQRCGGGEGGGE